MPEKTTDSTESFTEAVSAFEMPSQPHLQLVSWPCPSVIEDLLFRSISIRVDLKLETIAAESRGDPNLLDYARTRGVPFACAEREKCVTPPTAMKDHFSFRSKDEVICNDAVDSPTVSSGQKIQNSKLIARPLALEALLAKDDLVTRITASLFKKHIEDALEPLIGTVASCLDTQAEADRKFREIFLTKEEKKLALRREKLQLKWRRARCFQPTRRGSSASFTKLSQLTNREGLGLWKSPPH